jgi:hypothetical protein
MMIVPAAVKVHLALGQTDMRMGLETLSAIANFCPAWRRS